MKVVWTEDALRDLDDIAAYLATHSPPLHRPSSGASGPPSRG
ncbi:MAG: hypothetical protein QG656_299 [Candidatus Hydrogenedentes bacterium]|nr:hypothetical protein [Candidatus Hydrogenedentota bacterium]